MRGTDNWKCPECGRPKDAKASICIECFNKRKAKKIPPRWFLQRMLQRKKWNICATARYFEVSETAIRKWCVKYDLHRPTAVPAEEPAQDDQPDDIAEKERV